MWFLVLLILGVEFYNYYRQDREQQELEDAIEDLLEVKESMASELKKTRRAVRARERRVNARLSSGSKNLELHSGDPIKVKSRAQEYWKEQGWERKNGSFEGYYRTPVKSFKGAIERSDSSYMFYIYSLPKEVKNGGHRTCFQHRGHGKYWIHFARKPKGPSDGIMAVERILREALT